MRRCLSLLLILGIPACAATPGVRAHAAMLATLRRIERERAAPVAGELALGAPTLDRAQLVAAVLARNPELDAARATWQAATAEYPSAVAIDDPHLTYEVAPFSIGASVAFGQRVELSQKLPYPGKRAAAGDVALARAEAAEADYDTLRLELAEATVHAFDDAYLAARALEVNAHHHQLLERIYQSATAQYTVGKASQQDPLEAQGELIALDRERLMLETQQRTATARINRLLRRPATAALPPPPARLVLAAGSADATRSQPRHPRQLAAEARIRARTAALAGARREGDPDLELMASYDSMWSDWQHRVMVGVGIDLPLQRSGRRATVERAEAERAEATAELASVTDGLDEDRDRAQRAITEAEAALALDEQRALPTATARVDAALAGFTAGQSPLATVVMAEHALRDVELRVEQTRADLDRRLATLDRLSGRIAGGGR